MPEGWDKSYSVDSCTTECPLEGWDGYYVASSYWSDSRRNDTYILDSSSSRGSSGKGVTYWMESTGYANWAGGRLQVILNETQDELFIRIYTKYDEGFEWSDGTSNHGQQKIMRISSFPPIGDFGTIWGFGSGFYNIPVFYPDWYYNSAYDTGKFLSAERYGPGYNVGEGNTFSTDWSTDSKWHSNEFHVSLNSQPGIHDGIWKFYLVSV